VLMQIHANAPGTAAKQQLGFESRLESRKRANRIGGGGGGGVVMKLSAIQMRIHRRR